MTDPAKALQEARERYERMTPEEKAEMWEAQKASFIRGMGPCEHGVYDFETCPKCRAWTDD